MLAFNTGLQYSCQLGIANHLRHRAQRRHDLVLSISMFPIITYSPKYGRRQIRSRSLERYMYVYRLGWSWMERANSADRKARRVPGRLYLHLN
jgi:hypothetical protein